MEFWHLKMEGISSVSGSPAALKMSRNEGTLVTDRAKKIGHRRVNEQGMVTYKKVCDTMFFIFNW